MTLTQTQQEINTIKGRLEELAKKRAMFEVEFDVAMAEFNAKLGKLEREEPNKPATYRFRFKELLEVAYEAGEYFQVYLLTALLSNKHYDVQGFFDKLAGCYDLTDKRFIWLRGFLNHCSSHREPFVMAEELLDEQP